jgi:16S rRNA (cytidine1402-2'-O)-methyltransferase
MVVGVDGRATGEPMEDGRATGALVVVATPIGNLEDLSPRAARWLCEADLVLSEDTRHTGRLLQHVGSTVPQWSYHDHNERERLPAVLERLADGASVVLVSDAGTPGVSDPGYRLVAAAAAAGVEVIAVPGPSAALHALVTSGLPTDRFVFEGFLPRKGRARQQRLDEIAAEERTVVIFLSPHRAAQDLADLAQACGADRRAAVGRELTKLHEETRRGALDELAAWAADGAKGELTLVIGPQPARDEPAPDPRTLADQVHALMDSGTPKKDAMREVADQAGLPRREVYQALLDMGPD